MDVRNQGSQSSARPAAAATQTTHSVVNRPGKLHRTLMFLVTILVICALIFIGMQVYRNASSDKSVKSKQYQALFLTNGQVYFGHLSHISSDYVELTDIYYLQVQQQVQPGTTATNSSSQQVSLAKLGNELHGPEDEMFVAHSQVLFWENLKNSGKVVQAILNYQKANPTSG